MVTMKLLVFGTFLVSLSAQAQRKVAGPLEDANVVAVLLADSGSVAQKRVVQVLKTRGYQIQACDSVARRVETKTHQTPEGCLVSIEATVLGHTVLLSGKVYCELRSYSPKAISYSVRNRVPVGNFDCYKWGWNELAVVAERLGGKKVVSFRNPKSL